MNKASQKKTEEYLTESTFEKHTRSIACAFTRIDDTLGMHGRIQQAHSRALEAIFEEIKALRGDRKYLRNSMLSLSRESLSYDRRIGRLEKSGQIGNHLRVKMRKARRW